MDSPNISLRIRRHESLPCHGLHGTHMPRRTTSRTTTPSKAPCRAQQQENNSTTHRAAFCTKASFLIGRRLGATKNNPYVGSFRHSPPTSLRSMAASSLPSLSSMKEAASSSVLLSPSFAFAAANSPYVGWFRHAPPVFSSYQYNLGPSSSSGTRNKSSKTRAERTTSTTTTTKSPKKSSVVVQHKVNTQDLDRWHHQLTSLLLGVGDEETVKNPPLLLRQIINGRLLGGSGKEDGGSGSSNSSRNNSNIIERCNSIYQLNTRASSLQFSRASETIHSTVFSRLTSWLSFPLIYADDDCYDEYGCLREDYDSSKKTTRGLKFLLRPEGDRSIEIDSDDETDAENDDSSCSSSSSSIDYDPCGGERDPGLSSEVEREFSKEANLSVSEIAEAYYAQQLLDERRFRSNSDATTTSQQSGLSSPSSLHHSEDYYNNGEETRQRLDYEITQMDIARMARNASRHLDVDSILNLPTIVYRKKRKPLSPTSRGQQQQQQSSSDRSYLNVCTPIHEERNDSMMAQGGCIIIKGSEDEKSILSEDGWSFMLVSDIRQPAVPNESSSRKSTTGHRQEDGNQSMPSSSSSLPIARSEDEMCVICQEPFREGDRLRVLPCNHSFHVGCIDRWLSGTHSHNECFTAGCPTCKKRPNPSSSPLQQTASRSRSSSTENVEKKDDMSGSLPSWAFANLGSVMAMSSGDFLDDN